jgi:hypothetical protein
MQRVRQELQTNYVVTERAALVAWRLHQGEALTTAEIADLLGLQRQAARVLMLKICRVLPITQVDGHWMAV